MYNIGFVRSSYVVNMNFGPTTFYPIRRENIILKMPIPNGKWCNDGNYGKMPISIVELDDNTFLYVSRITRFDTSKDAMNYRNSDCAVAGDFARFYEIGCDGCVYINYNRIVSVDNRFSIIYANVQEPLEDEKSIVPPNVNCPMFYTSEECEDDARSCTDISTIKKYCWLIEDGAIPKNISFEELEPFTPSIKK